MDDNTTLQGDQLFQMDGGLVSMVREGMTVRDAAGTEHSGDRLFDGCTVLSRTIGCAAGRAAAGSA